MAGGTVLLVDGHSVIFSDRALRALHARNTASARTRLLQMLTGYQDASGVHVVCVFDGSGTHTGTDDTGAGVQVFYSAKDRTADAIIERLTAKYASVHHVTVATDDRMEGQTVVSFGANWILCAELFARMSEADTALQSEIRRLRDRR